MNLKAASPEARMEVVWVRRKASGRPDVQLRCLLGSQSAASCVEILKQGAVYSHVDSMWEMQPLFPGSHSLGLTVDSASGKRQEDS